MKRQNGNSLGVQLVILAVCALTLVMVLPTGADALGPNFVLTGTPGVCTGTVEVTNSLPGSPITNGCVVFIAGTYTDGTGNDFRIVDVSSSNKARILFEEGNVDKLTLAGVNVIPSEPVTNLTITFEHQFSTDTKAAADTNQARNGKFSGSWVVADSSTRTLNATAFAVVCPTPPCSGSALTPPPTFTIPKSSIAGTFSVGPDTEDVSAGVAGFSFLKGQIVISNSAKDKQMKLTHPLLLASVNDLPPFDIPGVCSADEHVGRIVRGLTDPTQDAICVHIPAVVDQKTGETLAPEDFVTMPGPQALQHYEGLGFADALDKKD